MKIYLDYKVISGDNLTTQHRVLVMDVKVNGKMKIINHIGAPRIKWWYLNGEKQWNFQHKILEGEFEQPQESANDMRNKMVNRLEK